MLSAIGILPLRACMDGDRCAPNHLRVLGEEDEGSVLGWPGKFFLVVMLSSVLLNQLYPHTAGDLNLA
jgi:hypothetical protein